MSAAAAAVAGEYAAEWKAEQDVGWVVPSRGGQQQGRCRVPCWRPEPADPGSTPEGAA